MNIIVLASDAQKAELMPGAGDGLTWIKDEQAFADHPSADAVVDLLYNNTAERNALVKQVAAGLVCVNSVTETLQQTDPSFIRFNGWSSFLSSPVLEAACIQDEAKAAAEEIFSHFGKKIAWLPDNPGFVTARVVSMIINEAYLALAEKVSSREEINTAMKLGTAYPFGPFEWAEKIGVQNIAALLQKLGATEPRYEAATLLLNDASMPT